MLYFFIQPQSLLDPRRQVRVVPPVPNIRVQLILWLAATGALPGGEPAREAEAPQNRKQQQMQMWGVVITHPYWHGSLGLFVYQLDLATISQILTGSSVASKTHEMDASELKS